MKKIISFILSAVLLLSVGTSAFAITFTDFASGHWAYTYVDELVADGTINGFTDGTFRPTGIVSRAEFVKMIGEGPDVRKDNFDDVPTNHWAYKYIMSSGLEASKDNMFTPSAPITRGEVAILLWKRAGSPMGITTPPVIHRQHSNSDAISWLYTNGIMTGADNVDLRLGDTLTRAEAAALIVRSRKVTSSTEKVNFITAIDPDMFEIAYNAFKLTDRPYDENAAVTNGEVAMMIARLMCGDDSPTYPNISAEITFDHPYAQPINMLCRYYLGLENDNAKYADKNATIKDTLAAFAFMAKRSTGVYVPDGDGTAYATYKSSGNKDYDRYISIAYANGLWFTTADELDLDKEITMKELACLAIEVNGFSGFYRASIINSQKTTLKNQKIRTYVEQYPKNSADYRIILASLPNSMYTTPFKSAVSTPNDSYRITNSFRSIFTSMFETWVRALSNAGYELEVSYYPGLAADNGNGYTLRVGITFKNVPANTRLGDLVNCVNSADADRLVNTGDMLYADVDTGTQITGVVTGIDKMVLSQIIY